MRPLLSLLTLALLSGCVAQGAAPNVTPAAFPSESAPASGTQLYHGSHAYDKPPFTETEVKEKFVVPNGTASLSFTAAWSSVSGAAATIPGGALIKLKDASRAKRAESAIGPGPLPPTTKMLVLSPAPGDWIAEYEGSAPGVTVTVTVVVG